MNIENEIIEDQNAFPTIEYGFDRTGCSIVSTYEGMSLRDYFAGKAMQGYCGGEYTGQSGMSHEQIAEWSFGMSDAMLKVRYKNKKL